MRKDGGTTRRIESWKELLSACDAQITEIALHLDQTGRRRRKSLGVDHIGAIIAGKASPETLTWSRRTLRHALQGIDADVIVAVTLRAYDPRMAQFAGSIILDYVDCLSESYLQRAKIGRGRCRSIGFTYLARSTSRVERSQLPGVTSSVAGGLKDALTLGATWLPNLVDNSLNKCDVPTVDGLIKRWETAQFDLLFSGTLDYPPNIDALQTLHRFIWPALAIERPGTTLCIAGRRPTPEVRRLAASMNAVLKVDFERFEDLAADARVAIAPLNVASGLQYKILDAAAHGLAQVVSPAVTDGLDKTFPSRVATIGDDFTRSIIFLLDHPYNAAHEAICSWNHVSRIYSPENWISTVSKLLDG